MFQYLNDTGTTVSLLAERARAGATIVVVLHELGPFEPLIGNKASARFVASKFTWIGSMNNEVSVGVAWHTSPVKTIEEATRQEMRAYVCGQCHVEYYFQGPEKRLVYPWAKGLTADSILEGMTKLNGQWCEGPGKVLVPPAPSWVLRSRASWVWSMRTRRRSSAIRRRNEWR